MAAKLSRLQIWSFCLYSISWHDSPNADRLIPLLTARCILSHISAKKKKFSSSN